VVSLFNQAVKNTVYIASNGTIINELRIKRVRKEVIVVYFKQISQNFLGGSEANHGKPQDSWWLGRYSNWVLPEYKSEAFPSEPLLWAGR
jgi:hypothetical protein